MAGNTSGLKPFTKGVSGNPGGRPKGYERQLRDVIDEMTAVDPVPDPDGKPVTVPAWIAIVKRAVIDAVAGDKYARDFVANRLIGKPREHIELTGGISPAEAALLAALQMTPEDRRRRVAEIDAEDRAELEAPPLEPLESDPDVDD